VSCAISDSTNSRGVLIYIYIIRLSANVFYSHFARAIILCTTMVAEVLVLVA